MKLRSLPNSSARLFEYASLYFIFYICFGLAVKYAQSPAVDGFPGLSELEFLIFSTFGSASVCLGFIFLAGWWRFAWKWHEIALMLFSGTCTALLVPTTTLMYSLPISVMVAMVLMRGSVIVISRVVDSLLLAQGVSRKQVRWEENTAALVALTAISLQLGFAKASDFDFLRSSAAISIFGIYLLGYALRLYFMNYFKFTRTGPMAAEKKHFFAIEQITAGFWVFGFLALAAWAPGLFHGVLRVGANEAATILYHPPSAWAWAVLGGIPFGLSAFYSAFLFLFEGRTSTFGGLVNRLSSLLAGTGSTLLFAFFFGGRWPGWLDWLAFTLILVAVGFLWRAERLGRQS